MTKSLAKQQQQNVIENLEILKDKMSVFECNSDVGFAEAFNIGNLIAKEARGNGYSARALLNNLKNGALNCEQLHQLQIQIASNYYWSFDLAKSNKKFPENDDSYFESSWEKQMLSSKCGFETARFLEEELELDCSSIYKGLLNPVCKEVIRKSEKMLGKSHLYAFMSIELYQASAPFFYAGVLGATHDLTERLQIQNPRDNVKREFIELGAQLMLLTSSVLELTSARANDYERTALMILKDKLSNSIWGSTLESMKLKSQVLKVESKSATNSIMIEAVPDVKSEEMSKSMPKGHLEYVDRGNKRKI